MTDYRLWRRTKPLKLVGGREVEVEVWAACSKHWNQFGEPYYRPLANYQGEVRIRVPKNAAHETENRPPELSTPGGTIPAKALLELYEPIQTHGEHDGE